MTFRRISIRGLLVIAGLLYGLITARLQMGNDNVWSRLGTAQSLVERGTFAIDGRVAESTVDKVYVQGHFYSDKPPTMALMAAAIYYPLYHTGFRLEIGKRTAAYGVITFLIMGISSLLCLGAFYGALGLVGIGESERVFMTAGLAFATLFFCWTTTLNNHAFSGAWAFICFYFILRARSSQPKKAYAMLLLAGGAVGLAAASDSAAMMFVVVFGLYIPSSKNWRPTVWYALAAFVIMLPGLITNYRIAGDLKPVATHAEFFHYPGSHWNSGNEDLTSARRNDLSFALHYAWVCLFGRNGFLLYNPLLMIAIYQGVRLIVSRKPFWREAILILVLSSLFAGYYFIYSSNYSGYSYSIRWFVTLIPLLWFLAFPFFIVWSRTKTWTYGTLFAVSTLVAAIGVFDQWPPTLVRSAPAFVINWDAHIAPLIARW